MEPVIVVHGGAGDVPDDRVCPIIRGVKAAALEGYKVLKRCGSAVDAIEAAIRVMEDDEYLNAGYGSVLNLKGEVEMDASIMSGSDLNAGAVITIQDVSHPVSVARLVMERTPHVVLSGEGAKQFARENGVPILPAGSLVTDFARKDLELHKKSQASGHTGSMKAKSSMGTVGAVAIDRLGNVAAATSTGGLVGKMAGRVGDTPQIGSGSYADNNSGAVSMTGHGESIMKFCLAHTICKEIENGKTAADATKESICKMTRRLNNIAGAIAVTKTGEIGISFSSDRMPWAYIKGSECHFGIEQGQHERERIEGKI